jgi:hypothetical protein
MSDTFLNRRLVIQSGGQTGVDRAALDFAVSHHVPCRGWCPKGGWAEDFPDPPGLLSKYPQLRETPSVQPPQRTAWNVRDSHATLILLHGVSIEKSPGTVFALQMAKLVFLRPYHAVDIASAGDVEKAARWVEKIADVFGAAQLVLNIAGPRESECPGIGSDSSRVLPQILEMDKRE